MSDQAEIDSIIVRYKGERYRRSSEQWYFESFGWHPYGSNPRYAWISIDKSAVPAGAVNAVERVIGE